MSGVVLARAASSAALAVAAGAEAALALCPLCGFSASDLASLERHAASCDGECKHGGRLQPYARVARRQRPRHGAEARAVAREKQHGTQSGAG